MWLSDDFYELWTFDNYRAQMMKAKAGGFQLSVFVNTDQLYESFMDMWSYYHPQCQSLCETELDELKESFTEFCAMNVKTVDVTDRRWGHVRAIRNDLRTVIPLQSFESWFLKTVGIIDYILQRDILFRIKAGEDSSCGNSVASDNDGTPSSFLSMFSSADEFNLSEESPLKYGHHNHGQDDDHMIKVRRSLKGGDVESRSLIDAPSLHRDFNTLTHTDDGGSDGVMDTISALSYEEIYELSINNLYDIFD
jgi:hypothetical protein